MTDAASSNAPREAPTARTAAAPLRIALIGYGEVGGIFGRALAALHPASLRTYDRLFDDSMRGAAIRERARADGVDAANSAVQAVVDADIVFSAVTADQTRAAATSVAPALRKGAVYVDVNSASPQTKIDCAQGVERAGGRYVEIAVMTSVPPYGIKVPMLAGGPHAAAVAPQLAALGFDVRPASASLGVVSAIKMCRSVIIKGMEALVIESFTSARRYGVEKEVLASLAETFPGLDWEKQGDYFFQRVVRHGQRRAEEMREAAVTVREAGLDPLLASATAQRQAEVARLAREGVFAAVPTPGGRWRDHADAMLARGESAAPGAGADSGMLAASRLPAKEMP